MRGRIAWVIAGISGILTVADVAITAQYRNLLSESAVAIHGFPFLGLAVVGSAVMGALIVSRDDRHIIGWLLTAIGLVSSVSVVSEAYSVWALHEGGPGSRSVGSVAGWISLLLDGHLALAALVLLFLLAPEGRLLSPRWRYVAIAAGLGAVLYTVGVFATDPTSVDVSSSTESSSPVAQRLCSAGFSMISVGLLAALGCMLLRLRASQGVRRQQLRIMALALGLISAAMVNLIVVQAVNGGRQTWASSVPLFLSYSLLPILFAIAVLRYRLYDVELIISRAVLLAFATAFAGIGYIALVVTASRLVDRSTNEIWLSLLATGLVALIFQPLRRTVAGLSNRLAFGTRAQPYEALSNFSRRLGGAPTPEALLSTLAEAAGRAVSAQRVVATLDVAGRQALSATWGQPASEDANTVTVPVLENSAELGSIQLALPRARPLRLSDARLLEALASQAAVAFRNCATEVQLAARVVDLDQTTHELALSRSRIVEADDEVRRTLSASISREVLPHLIAVSEELHGSQVTAAKTLQEEIEGLVTSVNRALESLRELTHGVFPTQLARTGLEPALRSFLAGTGRTGSIDVRPSATNERFSPRIEAAVYFSSIEAINCGADPHSVVLSVEDNALINTVSGVVSELLNLQGIQDRVEAAGGSLLARDDTFTLTVPLG